MTDGQVRLAQDAHERLREERHHRCPDGRSGHVRLLRAVPYGDHPGTT